MVDRAKELTLRTQVPAVGVPEFLEDVVTRHHLIGEGTFVARGSPVVLKLGERALHHFESGLVVKVVH